MIIDFHSHFLPAIDDGAQNVETSIQMLKLSVENNVGTIVATPHFNSTVSVNKDDAVNARNAAYNALCNEMNNYDIEFPKILRGFEVYFDLNTKSFYGFDKLCIENTNCLLIEMPFCEWDNKLIEHLYKLTLKDYKIVMAHIDRYYRVFGESVYKLFELDVMFQINQEMLDKMRERRFLKKLVSAGRICVAGSDMHNTDVRPTKILRAYEIAQKKLGAYADDIFCNNAYGILNL